MQRRNKTQLALKCGLSSPGLVRALKEPGGLQDPPPHTAGTPEQRWGADPEERPYQGKGLTPTSLLFAQPRTESKMQTLRFSSQGFHREQGPGIHSKTWLSAPPSGAVQGPPLEERKQKQLPLTDLSEYITLDSNPLTRVLLRLPLPRQTSGQGGHAILSPRGPAWQENSDPWETW